MNAVIYARYSSHSQREESIEDQVRECKDYAEKHGLTIVNEYCDYAISGRTADRPEFLKMIRDAEKKKFQTVIVYKPDRFARDRYDSAVYKAKLKRNGVRLAYAKMYIPEGPEGILLESIMEGYAEYYSANLAQDILRGMIGNAKQGKANGVFIYGYNINSEGFYEVNEKEAEVVRYIFEEYANGKSGSAIQKALTAKGIYTRKNKPFNSNVIRKMLRSKRYIGLYKFSDVVIENGMPAILTMEQFNAVQGRLEMNKRSPAKKWDRSEYILTGKLFCGHCGATMVGRAGRNSRNVKYDYYACSNQVKKHTCDKKAVKKEKIENYVINEIINLLKSPDVLDEIAGSIMEYQLNKKDRSVISSLEKRLREVDSSIDNILNAIEKGIFNDSTQSRLLALEDQRASIQATIEKEIINNEDVSFDQVIYYLKSFSRGDPKDIEFRNKLIHLFVSRLYLYDDKLIMTFNYKGQHDYLTLEDVPKQEQMFSLTHPKSTTTQRVELFYKE